MDAKLTVTPFSSSSVVPAAGTVITPFDPAASRSCTCTGCAACIGPEHRSVLIPAAHAQVAHRRRVLSGNAGGSRSAGKPAFNLMRRVASTTVMRRSLAGSLRELAHVVGDLDPVAGVEAQHVVATERLQLKLVSGNACWRRGCRRWRFRATI